MIPRSNVPTVALRPDVAEAIEQGRFHVWAAETIEQGIEVLTGVPAGQLDEHGAYPPDTIFGKVRARLEHFAATLKNGAQMAPEAAHPAAAYAVVPPPPGIPPQPPPEPPIEV